MIKISKEVQDEVKISVKKPEPPKPVQPAQAPANPPAAGAAVPFPTDLKEEVADPMTPMMLRSVAYCDQRITEINKQFDECMAKGIRVDSNQRSLLRLLNKQKGTMEQGCAAGAISPQEYLDILKEIMAKDQILAKYFNSVKDQPGNLEKMRICMARFKIMKQEA